MTREKNIIFVTYAEISGFVEPTIWMRREFPAHRAHNLIFESQPEEKVVFRIYLFLFERKLLTRHDLSPKVMKESDVDRHCQTTDVINL